MENYAVDGGQSCPFKKSFSVHNKEGVSCMGHNELLATVTELRSLRNLADELHDQIQALEDIVKNEMTTQGVDKLFLGDCKITWTSYTTSRLDSKKLKAENQALYNQYLTTTIARRFSIS